MTLPMRPLQESWAATTLEQELKDMLITLYDENLREQADDINAFGAPHLGSFSLVEKNFSADGLAVLRQEDEDAMRYLFKAWRHRNPKRGTHFLRTYLQALFSSGFVVEQMYQEKLAVYPESLSSAYEVVAGGGAMSDYYLTSRLRADIDTDVVPERVIRALRSAVAARFVLFIRIARFMALSMQVATTLRAVAVCRSDSTTALPVATLSNTAYINELSIVLPD